MQASGLSHIGRRPNNEDSYRIEPELGLFLVADGMGGYEGGDSMVYYGVHGPWAPSIEENIMKTVKELAKAE